MDYNSFVDCGELFSIPIARLKQGESYYFANKDNWIREENPVRHNCKHFLERLWGYLCAVVQQIARDPQSYTRYLEEHVPYQEREGHVVRGRILDVLPEWEGEE